MAAPKGQPPRNLSGTRTASAATLESPGDRGGSAARLAGSFRTPHRSLPMLEATVALDRPVSRARGEVGPFVARHIGPQPDERARMLHRLGFAELDDLVDAAMP